ncbi:alpha/beta hydrolase [Vannielia litorea]|uniref:alpha/beta hydrolase n=1 Tax=Vannielia litorea TaxID=1217970 RepID=UPI001C966BD4|nr:alpha/beta hydrolase [Vannielia litorea]MBY6046259.1 alpha/beta hydrolase [Vannielia litorea]MBY6073672.1 alpha/beta hydrolase [Vannielia litorea]
MTDPTAFDNAPFIPDGAAYPDRWAEAAREYRSLETALGRARLNVSYGEHPSEKYDLFYPQSAKPEGTLIYIHGGFWRAFSRADWSHFAAGATACGWAVAMPSYPLCPEVTVSDITRSLARAISAIALKTSGKIALTGHSAGGHLALRMLDPALDIGTARDRLTRCLPISPLTDLAPLREVPLNDTLQLTETEAKSESPVHQPAPLIPVHVLVGAAERPSFIAQANALPWDVPVTEAPELHHFNVIDFLLEADHPFTAWLTSEGAEPPNWPNPSA